jgi:hypothetical protein
MKQHKPDRKPSLLLIRQLATPGNHGGQLFPKERLFEGDTWILAFVVKRTRNHPHNKNK